MVVALEAPVRVTGRLTAVVDSAPFEEVDEKATVGGRRATSWPMLTSEADDVAVRVPVAPEADRASSAPSELSRLPPEVWTSNCSVIPVGGVKVAEPPTPKNPTSTSLAWVGLMEGATTEVDAALFWPPEASTGFALSTPEYAIMPPEALRDESKVHVYDVPSEAPATK